jgi:hypothetical protein
MSSFYKTLVSRGQFKKSFTDRISDVLGKDVLTPYFVLMPVSSSQIAVGGSIPESFYYYNHIILLLCLLMEVYFKVTNK